MGGRGVDAREGRGVTLVILPVIPPLPEYRWWVVNEGCVSVRLCVYVCVQGLVETRGGG